MGTQGLASHDINRSPQFVFQQKRDGHKVVEGFSARRKFDQQIYVTLRIRVISLKRPKQADAADAESIQIVSVTAQASNQVLFGLNCSHGNRKNCRQPRMLPHSIKSKLWREERSRPTGKLAEAPEIRHPPFVASSALLCLTFRWWHQARIELSRQADSQLSVYVHCEYIHYVVDFTLHVVRHLAPKSLKPLAQFIFRFNSDPKLTVLHLFKEHRPPAVEYVVCTGELMCEVKVRLV